jgi:hypothetical protein
VGTFSSPMLSCSMRNPLIAVSFTENLNEL